MFKTRFISILVLLAAVATGAWAQTTVNGLFTVNADGDQVQFASGNLRYTSGAWSFFNHQYDYYTEYSADAWDKFGWSTSGTTYGMSTSTDESLYKGDFVDWGNAVGTGWRTLSNDEWAYVVNTRSGSTIGTTANARFAKAVVCDVKGLIIFPDDYAHPNGVTAPTGINDTGATGMDGNSYDATAWALMESAGCVFLPTAGGRYNYSNPTLVVNAGNEGCYWSSTSNNSTANFLNFKQNTFYPSNTDSPRMGYSVRLVKSVTTYAVSLKAETADGANWTISPAKAAEGAKVTATYSGDRKVKSVKAVKKADNAYLKWDADQKKLVATDIPTTYNTVESANDGVTWSAGTYVVEGQVTIGGMITLNGDVDLIIKDGATLTAQKIIGENNKLYIYGQAQMTGELVVNCSNGDAIRELSTLAVLSAKVTATTSTNASGGIGEIGEFNVYGGLVDAKGTVASGYGICLNEDGSMNIYGGEVNAEGTGDGDAWGYGIVCGNAKFPATVFVYGGKLWAGNANNKAFNGVTLLKGEGFTGKIETCADNQSWDEYTGATTPTTKYVRVGY